MTDQFYDINAARNAPVRRTIYVDRAQFDVTKDAADLLIETNKVNPRIFLTATGVARVALIISKSDQPRYVIKPLMPSGLRGELSDVADWVADTRNGVTFKPIPAFVLEDLLERPDVKLKELAPLERIVYYPMFSRDGVLSTQSGYSPATGTWYQPVDNTIIPDVPRIPTEGDVAVAVSWLDRLLAGFPFVSLADKANIIALIIQPFVRPMIDGPTPAHVINAPREGTGKTLLADAALRVSCGQMASSRTESTSDEEWKKSLVSAFAEGAPVIYVDNIRKTLDSGTLASMITKGLADERLLGSNKRFVGRIQVTWVFTGNNISYGIEMIRRVIPTFLDANVETPHMGRSYPKEHDDAGGLIAWVDAHRGKLMWSALTIIQNWIAKGKKPWTGKPLGMFESYCRILGGILHDAGVDGFMDNIMEFYESSIAESDEMGPFVDAWYDLYHHQQIEAKDLVALASQYLSLTKETAGFKPKPTPRQMGACLKANNNRVYGNLKITSIIKKGKPNRYQLIQVGEVPTTERGVSAGVSAGGGVSSPGGYTAFAGVSSLNA